MSVQKCVDNLILLIITVNFNLPKSCGLLTTLEAVGKMLVYRGGGWFRFGWETVIIILITHWSRSSSNSSINLQHALLNPGLNIVSGLNALLARQLCVQQVHYHTSWGHMLTAFLTHSCHFLQLRSVLRRIFGIISFAQNRTSLNSWILVTWSLY